MTTPSTPQTLPGISDEQIARFKQVLYTLSGGDFDATDDEARQMLIAAHPHAAPAPSSVTEIVTLMMSYVAACVKFNHTPRGQMDAAEAEVQTAFKPLEAALTALVEERDRLRFELDGVNAMREVAAHRANAVPAISEGLPELRTKIGSVAHVQEAVRGMLVDEIVADISAMVHPVAKTTGAKFHRESFDDRAFFAAIERHMDAAGTNDKQLSKITGISSSTLSRMRNGTRVCDAASLAALSVWAGINPASYCNAIAQPPAGHQDRGV